MGRGMSPHGGGTFLNPREEKKQLLVIGGTGFIGHHLLCAAKEKNWDLSSLSLHYPKNERYVTGVKYSPFLSVTTSLPGSSVYAPDVLTVFAIC